VSPCQSGQTTTGLGSVAAGGAGAIDQAATPLAAQVTVTGTAGWDLSTGGRHGSGQFALDALLCTINLIHLFPTPF
jgi:hypothetical protein